MWKGTSREVSVVFGEGCYPVIRGPWPNFRRWYPVGSVYLPFIGPKGRSLPDHTTIALCCIGSIDLETKMRNFLYVLLGIYLARAALEFSFGKYAQFGAVFDYALVAGLCALLLWGPKW